jgi:opacity protein-like surface antigen
MRHYLLLLSVLLCTSLSFADENKNRPYIEGSVAYFKNGDLTVGNFRYDNGYPITASNITTGSYGTVGYQVELGISNIYNSNIRVSISESYIRQRSRTWGSITSNQNGTIVVRTEDIDKGYTKSNTYSINAYYDFYDPKSKFTPFIGASAGLYDNTSITKREPVYGLIAGINYDVTKNIYVGMKGQYLFVGKAITNDEGSNTLSAHNAYTVGASLGYKF